jgi:predicted butyrate kinase (DUF1464 family)
MTRSLLPSNNFFNSALLKQVRIGVSPAIISVVCLPKMRRADAIELFTSGEKVAAVAAAAASSSKQQQ